MFLSIKLNFPKLSKLLQILMKGTTCVSFYQSSLRLYNMVKQLKGIIFSEMILISPRNYNYLLENENLLHGELC